MATFLHILLILVGVEADICNHQATLVERDRFYITQPFQAEIELDLKNYFEFFRDAEVYHKPFAAILQNYSTASKLKEHEPWVTHPYDTEKNVIILPDEYETTKDAPSACAEKGSELIYINQFTKPKMVEVLKKLRVKYAPFAAIPFGKSIFSPSFHFIATPDEVQKATNIPEYGYPQLKRDGTILYPVTPKPVGDSPTTAAPTTVKSINNSNPDLEKRIVCFRKNNPWDLKPKQEGWLSKAARLARTLKIFDTLAPAFTSVQRVLKNLDRVKTNTSKKIKVALPTFMGKVVAFLKEFSNAARWEETVPADEDRFDEFERNLQTLQSTLQTPEPNLLNMRKQGKGFQLPVFNKENWVDRLQLDELHYGLTAPIEVQIIGTPQEATSEGVESVIAKIGARTYYKNDLMTLYAVEPNIINGEITTVKYVVSSPHTQFAMMDPPSLIDCFPQEGLPYKACRAIVTPNVSPLHEQNMMDCARALSEPGLSANFNKCPLTRAPDFPIAYRAQCDGENGTNVAIVNSQTPLKLSFVCNDREIAIEDVLRFPLRIATACAIQELKGETRKTILPQLQKEYLQSSNIGRLSTPAPSTDAPAINETLQKYLVPVGLFMLILCIVVLFLVAIIAIFEPSRLCCSKTATVVEVLEASTAQPRADFESSRISRAVSKRSLNTITLLC